MGIGAYRHRVTFIDPRGAVDPPEWYCSVQSAATQVVDGQSAFFVRGPYHPGITLETQIIFEGRTLQVQSVTDLDERHVELQLLCVEVVGRGGSEPLVLGDPPTILTPPVGGTVAPGQGLTLTVVAAGTSPLAYQWTKDTVDIFGARSATYATGPLTVTASYTVRVANGYGTVTSAPVTVAVGIAPTITTAPVGSTIESGESVTLTVVAAGTPPLSYQWTADGVDVPGATSATYVTGPLTTGSYSYAVKVSNAFGTVTSSPATVTVEAPASPLLDALVSYWKLDEASGTRVDSVGTNHLTPTNAPVGAAGKIGNGCDFEASSSQYVSHADPNPLGDEDFTYSLWFKRESTSFDAILIGKDHNTTRAYTVAFNGATVVQFAFLVSGVNVTTSVVDDTNWHFVVAWHDAVGNTINIQVDNGTAASTATGGSFATGTGEVRIGARQYPGFEGYFDGLIDEVALWRRVLTAQERTDLYNGGAGLAYPFA